MKFPKLDADAIQNFVIAALRISIVGAIASSAWHHQYLLLFASSAILLLTFVPHYFENKTKIDLPMEFELIIIGFIYATLYLGEIHAYYTKFWWWDVVLHTGSGIALGFAGFLILYILYAKQKIHAKPFWIALFAFCFALALGAVWEIFEFSMDQLFGTQMQRSGLIDTMWDLIVDAGGALFTSLLGFYYIKGKKTPLFTRLLTKFAKHNPKLFKR